LTRIEPAWRVGSTPGSNSVHLPPRRWYGQRRVRIDSFTAHCETCVRGYDEPAASSNSAAHPLASHLHRKLPVICRTGHLLCTRTDGSKPHGRFLRTSICSDSKRLHRQPFPENLPGVRPTRPSSPCDSARRQPQASLERDLGASTRFTSSCANYTASY